MITVGFSRVCASRRLASAAGRGWPRLSRRHAQAAGEVAHGALGWQVGIERHKALVRSFEQPRARLCRLL